jgi:hypothetical protein
MFTRVALFVCIHLVDYRQPTRCVGMVQLQHMRSMFTRLTQTSCLHAICASDFTSIQAPRQSNAKWQVLLPIAYFCSNLPLLQILLNISDSCTCRTLVPDVGYSGESPKQAFKCDSGTVMGWQTFGYIYIYMLAPPCKIHILTGLMICFRHVCFDLALSLIW